MYVYAVIYMLDCYKACIIQIMKISTDTFGQKLNTLHANTYLAEGILTPAIFSSFPFPHIN